MDDDSTNRPGRNKSKSLWTFQAFTPVRNVIAWFHSPDAEQVWLDPTERLVLIMLCSLLVRDEVGKQYNHVDERLTYKILGRICGLSTSQAKRVVKHLQERNMVRITPGTRSTRPTFRVNAAFLTDSTYNMGLSHYLLDEINSESRGAPTHP